MTSTLYKVQDNVDNMIASDIDQFADALSGANDVGQVALFPSLAAPAAPTVSVNTTSGNLNGAYKYAVAFVTGYWKGSVGLGTMLPQGNTGGGTASGTISPVNQQADIAAIAVGPVGTVARVLYRTKAGGSTYYFLQQINDNSTTSWTDNVADSSLTQVMPTTNTTGTSLSVGGFTVTAAGAVNSKNNTIDDGSGGATFAGAVTLLGSASLAAGKTFTNNGTITGGIINASAVPASGITGTLPIANGGTGSATKNFVDLTTAQTIGGSKTFINETTIKMSSPALTLWDIGTSAPAGSEKVKWYTLNSNNVYMAVYNAADSWQRGLFGMDKTTGDTTFYNGFFKTKNNTLDDGNGSAIFATAGYMGVQAPSSSAANSWSPSIRLGGKNASNVATYSTIQGQGDGTLRLNMDGTGILAVSTKYNTLDNGSGLANFKALQLNGLNVIGGNQGVLPGNDLNSVTQVGVYTFDNASLNSPWPGRYGIIQCLVSNGDVYNGGSNWIFQYAYNTVDHTVRVRSKINSSAWSTWGDVWTGDTLRFTSGYPEWNNAGTWQGVGGVKSIQRGTISIPAFTAIGTILNVTISSVNMAKTTVKLNTTMSASDGPVSCSVELTSATNLQFTNQNGSSGAFNTVKWEVTENN